MQPHPLRVVVAFFCVVVAAWAQGAGAQAIKKLALRGHEQSLHLYGSPAGVPVIVSSGDGGWIHLGPHVAQALAAKGYYAIGFDVRAYLASFTAGATTLRTEDEPTDYRTLIDFARRATAQKPILLGVSEGAGLSVLAASDPTTQREIVGVIGLGLPDINELGWRWKDALIYITHAVPKEPTFSAAAVVAKVAPVPLAAIHSTHDEFVPLQVVQTVLSHASEPKRLWIVKAADHRFTDNLVDFDRSLFEAIDWVRARAPR